MSSRDPDCYNPATMPPWLLEAEELTKDFDDFRAVDRVSLQVAAGEVVALLGPNGAGKTTTIRMLSSLLAPTRGWARIAGFDAVSEARRVRASIGLLTEHHGLYTRMRSEEYLDFFGSAYRIPARVRRRRIGDLLDQFGLGSERGRRLGEYSKGMRQKLALVRALLHDPPVLLLDEPTSAMDPSSAFLVRQSIADLRRGSRAIMICTHNLKEAELLADRIAIIRAGRIVALGTVDQLKREFLGSRQMEVHVSGALDGAARWLPEGASLLSTGPDWLRYTTDDPRQVNPELSARLGPGRGGGRDSGGGRANTRGSLPACRRCRPVTAFAGPRWSAQGAWLVARREILDQARDWRILAPILGLTLFFPLLMNFTAQTAVDFVNRYGAPLIGDRLIPFLLMVVGFFPISISLVIALELFAGERERLSLEPLLVTPLSDLQLYVGKMLASLVPPVMAAYLGITVYTLGLVWRIGWSPPAELMVQVVVLTTAQALVMVAGAVVISSLTTSVRAANLLASFIIIPVAQLVILESLVMFWGRYEVLWWIVAGLTVTAGLLLRMGLHLFNREELLGRDLDVLNLRWMGRVFAGAFVQGARSVGGWYRGVLLRSLPAAWPSLVVVALVMTAGYLIGIRQASVWVLPSEALLFQAPQEVVRANLEAIGFLSPEGFLWVLGNNLRAILLAALAGAFTLGVLALVLLMLPVALVGYFAGNFAAAGAPTGLLLTALVLPHGVFEIPAALLAGAAILRWGMIVVSPTQGRPLGEHWLHGLAEGARLFLGLVIPLLALAAAVEVFVTPHIALRVLFGG